MLRLRTKLLVALCGLAAFSAASPQTMYRCGSVYQDRPCDAGTKGRAVGSTTVGTPAAAAASDAECAQRARDSNKIVWAREGGATEERLLSEARSVKERRLIQDVYRRPGAASTVQAAVEADCVAEKQREEQDLAIAIAAGLKARREGGGAPQAGTMVQPDAKTQEQLQQQAAAHAARQREHEAEQKKRRCASYGADMDRIRQDQRAGGSAARMDALNEHQRQLRDEMGRAGC